MQKRKILIISIFTVFFIFVISILLNLFVFSHEARAQTSLPPDCELKTFKKEDSDKPPFPSFCQRYSAVGNCAETAPGTPTASCPYCKSWKIGNEAGKEIACDLELQKKIAGGDATDKDGGHDPCNIEYGDGKCKNDDVWKCASNIGYGAKQNCEVYTLQFFLKKLGFYGSAITGIYDRNLCNAVKEFQRQNGIQQNGAVGPDTAGKMWQICLNRLSADLCCKVFLSQEMPPPEPPEPPPPPPPADTQCFRRCDVPLIPCSMTGDPPPKCNLCYLFKLIQNIICYLTWCIAGPLAVISMLIAGVLYLTARGDPGQINLAKDIIQAAVIGLIIVFCAWIIVNTVITLLGTGSPYSNWWRIDCTIPSP